MEKDILEDIMEKDIMEKDIIENIMEKDTLEDPTDFILEDTTKDII